MPPKKKQAIATPQVEAEQQQQAITPKSRSQRRRERQRRRQAQLAPRVLFEKPAPDPKSSPDESSSDEEEIESPRERDVRRRRAAPRRTGHARTLDKFYGHDYDEPRNWLYQVEAVADADGWSRRERLQNARVVLSGRARSEVVAFERQLQRRDKRVTWAQEKVWPCRPASLLHGEIDRMSPRTTRGRGDVHDTISKPRIRTLRSGSRCAVGTDASATLRQRTAP